MWVWHGQAWHDGSTCACGGPQHASTHACTHLLATPLGRLHGAPHQRRFQRLGLDIANHLCRRMGRQQELPSCRRVSPRRHLPSACCSSAGGSGTLCKARHPHSQLTLIVRNHSLHNLLAHAVALCQAAGALHLRQATAMAAGPVATHSDRAALLAIGDMQLEVLEWPQRAALRPRAGLASGNSGMVPGRSRLRFGHTKACRCHEGIAIGGLEWQFWEAAMQVPCCRSEPSIAAVHPSQQSDPSF